MRVIRTLELARVGEWGQDSAPITRKDLAEVVETFAGKPPLGIGHESMHGDDAPRLGGVQSVKLADSGNTLVGDTEFGDYANNVYSQNLYDGWSVSIPRRAKDGKRYLHHLALTGATPPKIPDLKELDSVRLNDYADGDIVQTHQFSGAIRSQGETIVTEEEAEKLKRKNEELETENAQLKKPKAGELPVVTPVVPAAGTPAAAVATPTETPAAGLATATIGPSTVPQEFSDKLQRLETENRKTRVDKLLAQVEGKIPEGISASVRALGDRLAGDDGKFDFSDNGQASKQITSLDLLGEILQKWPKGVKTGSTGFDFSDANGDSKATDWGKIAQKM